MLIVKFLVVLNLIMPL